MSNLEVANTILSQIGGRGRLSAMLGAKDFLGGERHLQFKFAAKAANKANTIKIILDPSDTYTVEMWSCRGTSFKKVFELEGVYAEDLLRVMEGETKLAFRL